MKQAIILAGGKGKRLGALAQDLPKPLVPIAGKPMVTHALEVLRRHGVEEVLMLSGHLGEKLEAHFGDGGDVGLNIRYLREEQPLGTAGALRAACGHLQEDFFVVYGDIVFDMDMHRLAAFHAARQAVITAVVHPNDHPHDSDLVAVDDSGYVRAMRRKDSADRSPMRNLVNTGIYAMSRRIVDFIPPETFLDFGLDVMPALIGRGERVAGYRSPEYMKDVGTLDRLTSVEQDILRGEVARRNLSHPRPAIFLDRDGVLNVEKGEGAAPEALELLPGAAEAVRAINKSGYLAIVVTNQPGIAKGFLTFGEVEQAHMRLDSLLGEQRAFLDDIYFCPHHPEKGFAGERAELKIACDCRKPGAGMLLQAAARYNIDLAASYLIGDRTADMLAVHRAGGKAVLVRTGHGGRDGQNAAQPDYACEDIAAAVAWIGARP